jgi:septal ring factor EnvC (AmiA/AmiB activator)
MDFESLHQLEERVEELTKRFIALKQDHQKIQQELGEKDKKIGELNERVHEFDQTKAHMHSRIENILKRLEFLKVQSGI